MGALIAKVPVQPRENRRCSLRSSKKLMAEQVKKSQITPNSIFEGFGLSNMTIIEGKTGWIIIDPLTTMETSSRAIAFARKHLKEKPIVAIIFTHSHIDHFGGVLGVLSPEEIEKQQVRIIAPKGFMAEATSENVIAGIGMLRRAEYMYGKHLSHSTRWHVDGGLGKTVPFLGTVGILPPTEIVDKTPQEMVIDGIRFVFQYAPESEAPAELTLVPPMSCVMGRLKKA